MKRLFCMALVALSPLLAHGEGPPIDSESFTLPETQEKACMEARRRIALKRESSTSEILKGSPGERYLENLVRICSNLPIYTHGAEAHITVGQGTSVHLPDKNHVFRLSSLLIKKRQIAETFRNRLEKTRGWYARKYGPLEELPWLSYCLVEVADYLELIGEKHTERSGKLLVINSAFRAITYQEWLRLESGNGNAIPVGTPTGSTHGTLATVDIGYGRGFMSPSEQRRFEKWIAEDERNGRIQATKEHRQTVYHIMVFPKEFFRQMAKLDTAFAALNEGSR